MINNTIYDPPLDPMPLEPFERGVRIPPEQWYFTMYSKGFQPLWNMKAEKKDYVKAIVTHAFLTGMEDYDQILTLVRCWGRKHNLAIDDADLIDNIIPEQDAFTRWIRLEHQQEQLLEVLNRDKDKLSYDDWKYFASDEPQSLAVAFDNFTDPNHPDYDPLFDEHMRETAPHWFETAVTKTPGTR